MINGIYIGPHKTYKLSRSRGETLLTLYTKPYWGGWNYGLNSSNGGCHYWSKPYRDESVLDNPSLLLPEELR